MHRQLSFHLVGLLGLAAVGCGSDDDDNARSDIPGASAVTAVTAGPCEQCHCYEADTWPLGYELENVPQNPRVLVAARDDQSISLREREGDDSELQFYVEASGAEGLVWLRPRAQLKSGRDYEIRVRAADADAAQGKPLVTLHAESDIDSTPLSYSGASLQATTSSGTCDLAFGARLEVRSLRDDMQPDRRVYAEIDFQQEDQVDKTTRIILPFIANGSPQSADFGAGPEDHGAQCLLGRYVADADAAISGTAHVVFYDLGGNATPVEDALDLTFGEVTGEACPTASNGGFGGDVDNRNSGCSTIATPARDVTSLSFWLASALLVSWRGKRAKHARRKHSGPDNAY